MRLVLISDAGKVVSTGGTRLSLGPTWVEDFRADEEGYIETGGQLVRQYYDSTVIDDHSRAWARNAIEATTGFRVSGWSGATPFLEAVSHEVRIYDGNSQPVLAQMTDPELARLLPGVATRHGA